LNVAAVVKNSKKGLDEEESDDDCAKDSVTVGVNLSLVCWLAESAHLKIEIDYGPRQIVGSTYLSMIDASPDTGRKSTKKYNETRDLEANMNPEDMTTC
jgi:hypothetical protein